MHGYGARKTATHTTHTPPYTPQQHALHPTQLPDPGRCSPRVAHIPMRSPVCAESVLRTAMVPRQPPPCPRPSSPHKVPPHPPHTSQDPAPHPTPLPDPDRCSPRVAHIHMRSPMCAESVLRTAMVPQQPPPCPGPSSPHKVPPHPPHSPQDPALHPTQLPDPDRCSPRVAHMPMRSPMCAESVLRTSMSLWHSPHDTHAPTGNRENALLLTLVSSPRAVQVLPPIQARTI